MFCGWYMQLQFPTVAYSLYLKAGGNITVEFKQKFTDQTMTSTADDDMWFRAFKAGCEKSKIKYGLKIFPAGTDSRYIREVGIPAFGFSPMPNTPVLLHDHNEFLNEKIFLDGIPVFCNIIKEIANV